MAVAEPPSKDTSAVALPGLARALVAAGKLGQKAAEDIYRKALTGKPTSFQS
jgi:type IV pilus assembly protein PilB